MKKVVRFSFLHLSFFIGALILDNFWIFLALPFLAGLVPKLKVNFFYYLLLSLLAFVVALFMQPIPSELSTKVNDILGWNSVSLWLVIMLVSMISMSLLAKTANILLLNLTAISPKPKKEEEDDDGFY